MSATALLALAASLLLAAAASARSQITGVAFTGSLSAPSITVTGTGFGSKPPAGTSDSNTSCGDYGSSNGDVYRNSFWFLDDTNVWQAGYSNSTGANCIGIVIDSWTNQQVVFHFGVAYDSFGNWFAASGDDYVIDLKGWYWGGLVTYAASARDPHARTHPSRHTNRHR